MKKPQALTAQMIEDAKGGFELVNTMVGSFKDATAFEKITPAQWLRIARRVCKLPPGLLEGNTDVSGYISPFSCKVLKKGTFS
jgi:hypothetical protein